MSNQNYHESISARTSLTTGSKWCKILNSHPESNSIKVIRMHICKIKYMCIIHWILDRRFSFFSRSDHSWRWWWMKHIYGKANCILTAWMRLCASRITTTVISLVDRARILRHHTDLIPHAADVLACPSIFCEQRVTRREFSFSGESSSSKPWPRDWIWFIKTSFRGRNVS